MTQWCHTTTKLCATCNFWQGKVSIAEYRTNGESAYVFEKNFRARCCNPESRSHNKLKKGTEKCVKHMFLQEKEIKK